ncbi:DNA alkylation repair protein [Pseudactinotalea sp. Z1732]|uniref:DNA alkylation repair protein n=2 Tax=Micrococcales TaxID=85006 RepID=UPI003C7E2156
MNATGSTGTGTARAEAIRTDTTGVEQIFTALREVSSPTERDKVARRLPPDSGLAAVGVRMRDVFDLAKSATDLPVSSVPDLLASRWYEVRMVGVSILDFKARRRGLSEQDRRALYEVYLDNHHLLTAWDFIDRAAPRVVGAYLVDRSRQPLFDLARSEVALERRTAITAAFWLIGSGDLEDPLALARMLVADPSPWVTKPVGTALRQVGTVDEQALVDFLNRHHQEMTRPSLRLATSNLDDATRAQFIRPRR